MSELELMFVSGASILGLGVVGLTIYAMYLSRRKPTPPKGLHYNERLNTWEVRE